MRTYACMHVCMYVCKGKCGTFVDKAVEVVRPFALVARYQLQVHIRRQYHKPISMHTYIHSFLQDCIQMYVCMYAAE